ncbi:MAG: ATP-dependent Clp protease adaptor ClpS [Bacteroidales bacterium]|nr:ATP-dependent Clp protease adaptor ClpS [Bacteroidales bacterium]
MRNEKIEKPYVSPQADEAAAVLEDSGCSLVLFNDDVHTFDYVIKALMDICRHTEEQAEQCAILVHCHGKCTIKHGSYETLLPMHTALLDKQLTSEIQ